MNGCSCAKNELSLHTEKTSTHERATEASTVHTFPFRVVHKNIPPVLLVSTSASTFDAPALPSMPLAIGFSMNLASLPVTLTQRPFKRLVLGTLPVWGKPSRSQRTNSTVEPNQQTTNDLHVRIATSLQETLPLSRKVHHLLGLNTCALTRNTVKITVGVVCVWCCDVMVMCMMVTCVVRTYTYSYSYTYTYAHTKTHFHIHTHIYIYQRHVRRTTADSQRD